MQIRVNTDTNSKCLLLFSPEFPSLLIMSSELTFPTLSFHVRANKESTTGEKPVIMILTVRKALY